MRLRRLLALSISTAICLQCGSLFWHKQPVISFKCWRSRSILTPRDNYRDCCRRFHRVVPHTRSFPKVDQNTKRHLSFERFGKELRWVRGPVSYTHLRAHETPEHLVCRLLLEK